MTAALDFNRMINVIVIWLYSVVLVEEETTQNPKFLLGNVIDENNVTQG